VKEVVSGSNPLNGSRKLNTATKIAVLILWMHDY
jgi:hypothetical protein